MKQGKFRNGALMIGYFQMVLSIGNVCVSLFVAIAVSTALAVNKWIRNLEYVLDTLVPAYKMQEEDVRKGFIITYFIGITVFALLELHFVIEFMQSVEMKSSIQKQIQKTRAWVTCFCTLTVLYSTAFFIVKYPWYVPISFMLVRLLLVIPVILFLTNLGKFTRPREPDYVPPESTKPRIVSTSTSEVWRTRTSSTGFVPTRTVLSWLYVKHPHDLQSLSSSGQYK